MTALVHIPMGRPVALPAVVLSIDLYPPESLAADGFADAKDCLLRRLA